MLLYNHIIEVRSTHIPYYYTDWWYKRKGSDSTRKKKSKI